MTSAGGMLANFQPAGCFSTWERSVLGSVWSSRVTSRRFCLFSFIVILFAGRNGPIEKEEGTR